MTLFEEMDLESEGKLSFKQVMGGEESPLESLFRYETMMSMMVSLQTTLFRSMDKGGRGSISKDVNIIYFIELLYRHPGSNIWPLYAWLKQDISETSPRLL